MLQGILHCPGSDLVEGDPARVFRLYAEQISQMPGNRFALPVRVRRQIDLVRFLGKTLQFLDQFSLAADVDVFRSEMIFDVNAELALWQIPKMAHGCLDCIILSQETANCLGLSRRFHNHQVLCHRIPPIMRNIGYPVPAGPALRSPCGAAVS